MSALVVRIHIHILLNVSWLVDIAGNHWIFILVVLYADNNLRSEGLLISHIYLMAIPPTSTLLLYHCIICY